METMGKVATAIVALVILRWGWKLLNWIWLKPKKLEKWLRSEGYKGNSYKFLMGDMIELATIVKEGKSKPIPVTHDITSYALPFDHHIISKYGEKSFIWLGPNPRMYIRDPELIKEILLRPNEFRKPHPEPFRDSIIRGLLVTEGHKWTKHRKIINPAFNLQNLTMMFSAISLSCSEMIHKWELLTAGSGPTEVDVWPYIDNLAGDVISRTAFGSSYEEGQKIFRIQKEQINLLFQMLFILHLPGRRFIPTQANKKFKENVKELRNVLMGIINKRKKAIDMGEGKQDDLLGILLASNTKEIEEHGVGMSMEDVIEECKLFYIAGSETTSNLIVWTMVCLSLHQEWQIRAREEIVQAFGNNQPDFEGLKNLKILTMILNEVLRLYPPVIMMTRATHKDTKLGNMMIPSGVQLTLAMVHLHHDREIWGDDVNEFNPERFAEGIVNATKGKGSSPFFPFSNGPRVCIGQNLAMTEAKTAMALILQRFSFELSPSYKHSPFPVFTLPPQFGAHLILRNIS
ncbi:putative secologanin synthase [Helianthus annuus]|uniref:Secologanin synthase n=1 Tax=Helianthus annuus TaxID=4232 RepID=A0A9K3NBF0_HELAN|nr:cytochrome P450 CYP72A219-like [Helianthus annuus]KAF5794076.1 putative secologanin synthase [Helianthus annuus]KAJ0537797.1 putative secologanin synthase [Helianthus annuus]KAJ0552381.1 putative secologanin synthase [Helianthus annuus]KAJ0721319.1 putative secologanin synthase [Helianthus annuus]KAJ0896500.1 putative secologanin synthase [Helianthus annuus]